MTKPVCAACGTPLDAVLRRQKNGWTIRKCPSCALVQISPKPSEAAVASLYAGDWGHFDPYRSQEDAHRTYFDRLLTRVGIFAEPSAKTPKLLDVGCATGILLEEAVKHGYKPTGLDISSDAAAYCRSRGLSVQQGRVVPWAKKAGRERFDIVTLCEVIEHEYDPASTLKAVRSILTPTGITVVTTPNFDTKWRRIMGGRWVGYSHPEHLWFFTPKTLKDLFIRAGYSDVIVVPDENRPYRMSYAFRRLADYNPALAPVFSALERVTERLKLKVPVNPWGDMLAIARR